MFVMSIGVVYAMVMVIYFCKRNLQKYEFETIWNNVEGSNESEPWSPYNLNVQMVSEAVESVESAF